MTHAHGAGREFLPRLARHGVGNQFGHAVRGIDVDPEHLVEVGKDEPEHAHPELSLRVVRLAKGAEDERHE